MLVHVPLIQLSTKMCENILALSCFPSPLPHFSPDISTKPELVVIVTVERLTKMVLVYFILLDLTHTQRWFMMIKQLFL